MANQIVRWLAEPNRGSRRIAFVNPHVFNLSVEYPRVCRWLENCHLVCVDGVGVQLALRVLHGVKVDRVVAEELFRDVLFTPGSAIRALLVGVERDEVESAAVAINHSELAIGVVAWIDGFNTDQEYQDFCNSYSGIDLVLIGAGTPRSESIAVIVEQGCPNALCWHIGAGTIKTWAGSKRRAPAWISRAGIQWLHRMVFEPHTRARYVGGAFKFFRNLYAAPK